MNEKIKSVKAREVLDSRGLPTIEVEVTLQSGVKGVAKIPSGASKGKNEALELRDGDSRYWGKGVRKAVKNVEEISKRISGISVFDQKLIDETIISLDGTENKSNLGANACLGVSLACAQAASNLLNIPLYRYIGGIQHKIPVPLSNFINGGLHAGWNLDFQEFLVVPLGFDSFSEALRSLSEIFHSLRDILLKNGFGVGVGDEGGFSPKLKGSKEALELLSQAVEKSKRRLGEEIFFALDLAASNFWDETKERYILKIEGKEFKTDEFIDFLEELVEKFPIISLEDPLHEEDWSGWSEITKRLGSKIQILGDDIFVTNPKRLKKGISNGVANAVLIKPNQIGTLTETLNFSSLASRAGYLRTVSHRSGETEDALLADLAVGINSEQIKTGGMCRSERISKYNRLLKIEEEIGGYMGRDGFKKFL